MTRAKKQRPVLTLKFPTLTMPEAILLATVLEGPNSIDPLLAQLSGWAHPWASHRLPDHVDSCCGLRAEVWATPEGKKFGATYERGRRIA